MFGKLLLVCCIVGLTSATLEDEVERFFWGTAGEGNANAELHHDVTDGEQNLMMITEVHIGYYEKDDIKDIRCIQFYYGDEANPCQSSLVVNTDVFVLESDEYITEVSGNDDYFIKTITIKTNKKSIGPYGQPAAGHEFVANNNGSPLLFAKITSGLFVYEMSFTFYGQEYAAPVTTLNLTDVANKVATETNEVLDTDVLKIMDVRTDYEHMLFDVAKKVCALYGVEQTPEVLSACNLQHILGQINVLASSVDSHYNHVARNLFPYKNTDMNVLLNILREAEEFHKLSKQLDFGFQSVIDITLEQSQQLNEYFSAQAKFDHDIAVNDVAYIQGQLERTKAGAATASEAVGERLIRIIDTGIAAAVAEAVDKLAQLGTIIAENLNPFKWLFGGPEFEDIFEAAEEFLEQVRMITKLSYLCDHVQEYLDLCYDLADKFAENAEQIAAMEELVNKFDTAPEDEIIELSEDFVQAYGAYTPMVTEQDITYLAAILGSIGDEACGALADIHGLAGDTLAMYEEIMQDCLYLPADQATLDSYWEETYSLQFEMVDALTAVVRYTVALHMAENIGEVGTRVDVQAITIGDLMLEIQYQATAQARCDILEYVYAALRPDICQNLLFTDQQIINLIAYKSSQPVSKRNDFTYFPTSNEHSTNFPYIDIEKLLRGQAQTFILPINNTEWLQKYKWLPGHLDPETAYYYEVVEAYIPGLTCNETNKDNARVFVEMLSAKPQSLYKELSEPTFSIYQHLVRFTYDTATNSCPGEYVNYAVVRNDTDNFEADLEEQVCVISKGEVASEIVIESRSDFTLPSLYSQWHLSVSSDDDCTLVFKPDFNFYPLVTFKVKIREVSVKADPSEDGIDECWPSGSRCAEGLWCHDALLGYTCSDSQYNMLGVHGSHTSVVSLLTDIRDGLYKIIDWITG